MHKGQYLKRFKSKK